MGVKSARVQRGVAGDDLVFEHTLTVPAVVGNQEGPALVDLEDGDTATAFYASKQNCTPPAVPDTQSAVVAGTGASSYAFTIVAASSALMEPGEGQTVRIEITRADETKETLYLYDEYDLQSRGFPSEPTQLNLP